MERDKEAKREGKELGKDEEGEKDKEGKEINREEIVGQ